MIKKLETLGAAVAFAEGGDFKTTRELLAELRKKYQGSKRNIVMVAHDVPIKPGLVEYAQGLASRLKCDALFLNIFSDRPRAVRLAKKYAAAFKAMWKEFSGTFRSGNGPETVCEHAVLLGNVQDLLQEVCRCIGGVEMVIVQKRRFETTSFDLCVPVFHFYL